MKKGIILCLMIVVLLLPVTSNAQSSTIGLTINGNNITKGAPPVVINSTSYIPLRNLFENIGFSVVYEPQSKSATAYYLQGYFRITFTVNSNVVNVNPQFADGKSTQVRISNSAIIHNGSVYVPLRAFGELLGAEVSFNKQANTVYFNLVDIQIEIKVFPMVGLSLTKDTLKPTKPDQDTSVRDNNTENTTTTEKKILTVKEIARLMDRVGYIETYDGYGRVVASGSGFVLNGGLVITNSHVVEGAWGFKIKVDGMVYDNKSWYMFNNPTTDIFGAFISTKYDNEGRAIGEYPSKYFEYTTALPEVGDKIYAIGSPLGLENTISDGIVSGIRKENGIELIQHTADTESGSSGGVLLNEYGEVIGVTSSGFTNTNLDFAIPMKYVQDEIDKVFKQ